MLHHEITTPTSLGKSKGTKTLAKTTLNEQVSRSKRYSSKSIDGAEGERKQALGLQSEPHKTKLNLSNHRDPLADISL